MPAETVIDAGGLTTDENHYVDPLAQLDDLDGMQLINMYKCIGKKAGYKAANNFAALIFSMDNLTPGRVVDTVKRLAAVNWGIAEKPVRLRNLFTDTKYLEDLRRQFGMEGMDQTEAIKAEFLKELERFNR